MLFFHLSDLHIGIKLYNRDLFSDQAYVFSQIVNYAAKRKPNAVVIAGDIYDKAAPSAEAVEVFDHFVSALHEAVPDATIMMISGNHDSASRVNCFRSVLSFQHIYMIGQPPREEKETIAKVELEDAYGPVNFYLLPFVRPSMVRKITGTNENGNNLSYSEALHALIKREEIRKEERNVLVSHQFYVPAGEDAQGVERMDSEVQTIGNIDAVSADILQPFDYAALGHIHKPMCVGSAYYRYCGTPMPYSVSEAGQEKGIIEVEMREKGCVEARVLPLAPLRKIRVIRGSLQEVLQKACTDYVRVVLTTSSDSGKKTLDVQDRLRAAFPNLLEIRREDSQHVDYAKEASVMKAADPFTLCSQMIKDMQEDEKTLLFDVIQTVQEEACGH